MLRVSFGWSCARGSGEAKKYQPKETRAKRHCWDDYADDDGRVPGRGRRRPAEAAATDGPRKSLPQAEGRGSTPPPRRM